jgi:hypothetical protein
MIAATPRAPARVHPGAEQETPTRARALPSLRKIRKAKSASVPLPRFVSGDLLVFAGKGDLYSRVGRWIMQGDGEGPTYAVHAAQFLDSRRILEMDMVARVKTVEQVVKKQYRLDLWQRRSFEVWRCRTFSIQQRRAITREALAFVDVRFGGIKFAAHLLDGLIYKLTHREVFLFRRLDRANDAPVCSGIVASSYDRALQYRFGVPPDCADPDHIHDWVRSHPDDWVRVFSLEKY